MEVRPSRGRGGSGKRGGRGGNDGDSQSGEHRGRGRGGHYHRGRSKRDHHRGQGGRGASGHAAGFRRDQDEGDFQDVDDDDDGVRESFSRRKLECNWDRYEASEKEEAAEDTPTQRGTDYSVLIQSAGDSFTQFRFWDEKVWEMDSFVAGQMLAFVDLPSLAQSLQQVPLRHRLNLQSELIQVSTPVALPTQLPPKSEISKTPTFTPPSATAKVTVTTPLKPLTPSVVESPEEDMDELDQLLSLDKPVSASGNEANAALDQEKSAPEKVYEEVKKNVPEVVEKEDKMAEVKDKRVSPASVKTELTEDDLEDWLDSMIS